MLLLSGYSQPSSLIMKSADLGAVRERRRVSPHELLGLRILEGLNHNVGTDRVKSVALKVSEVVPAVAGSTSKYSNRDETYLRAGDVLDIFQNGCKFFSQGLPIVKHEIELILGRTFSVQC
jgi:hypothetical protein